MEFSETYVLHLIEIRTPDRGIKETQEEYVEKRRTYAKLRITAGNLLSNPESEGLRKEVSRLVKKLDIEW
jgi:hypothetical protein